MVDLAEGERPPKNIAIFPTRLPLSANLSRVVGSFWNCKRAFRFPNFIEKKQQSQSL